MTKKRAGHSLARRLESLRKKHGESVPLDAIADLLREYLGGPESSEKVLGELAALAKYIAQAKAEIASIRPEEVKHQFLPSATDELDAIVEATEDATNAIMDATEIIEESMADVSPEVAEKLTDATTRIYEACTFQDITGQRINKVVKALKHIEERVDALMTAVGGPQKRRPKKPAKAAPPKTAAEIRDEDLLEGPQLNATKQDEIDALLSSLD